MDALLQSVKTAIDRQNGKRFASAQDAFRWLRMPGMELSDDPVDPRLPTPIVNRCWCGKPISKGRNCCRDCREAELKRTAGCLTTQEALDLYIESVDSEDRDELLAELKPYLHITDFVEPVSWRCGCGETGEIHVRRENQPDNAVVQMALEFHHNTTPECPIVGVESKGCMVAIDHKGEQRAVEFRAVVKDEPIEVYPDVDWD